MKKINGILKVLTLLIISLFMLENTHSMELQEPKADSTNEVDDYYEELLELLSPSIKAGMEFYDKYHHLTFDNVESITDDMKKELVKYEKLLETRVTNFQCKSILCGYTLHLLQKNEEPNYEKGVIYIKIRDEKKLDYFMVRGRDNKKISGSIRYGDSLLGKEMDITQERLDKFKHIVFSRMKDGKSGSMTIKWGYDLTVEKEVQNGNFIWLKVRDALLFNVHADPLLFNHEYKNQLSAIESVNRKSPNAFMANLFRAIVLDVMNYRNVLASRLGGVKIVEWLRENESVGLTEKRSEY